MKKFFTLLLCLSGLLMTPSEVQADDVATEDTLFVVKNDGTVDVFPSSTLKSNIVVANNLKLTLLDGTVLQYPMEELESYDHQIVLNRPTITSFKFNNKFNHQVFSDIECEISEDNRITGQIGAIGHWLTPSFKRSDKRAEVYLDGKEQLVSKHSRLKFGSEHTITVAYPGIQVMKNVMVDPGTGGTTTIVKEEIPLTVDMLSTNAPSNYPEREGLDKMLDNDPNTYFHSTWGSGEYEKLPLDEFPYIEITLPEPVFHLVYEISNRYDTSSRSPEAVSLMASADGSEWIEVHRFMEANGFSSAQGATNTSSLIDMEEGYSHFRLYMLKGNYKNYFCISELKLYTAEEVTEGGTEPTYANRFEPFGTDYQLHLDWLKPTGILRIELNGDIPSSKDYYFDSEITIDGAGFYPSMAATEVQIKGRGNSSWSSNMYSKNPYRLKFAEKQKPFGMKSGKSWVLLANRQSGSMLTNAIGMYAAGLIGADGANHIVPVDLFMNDMYWGSYNFTEKVGLANNSIDLEDESMACRIELDTYTDEQIYKSDPYRIPVKIKDPDFSEGSAEITSDQIMARFNAFTQLVKNGEDISQEVDVESMARFLVVDELILNYELLHPKSTFLYHENVLEDTCKWKWGPIWDLDWSYGYEGTSTYFQRGASDVYWSGKSMEATTFIKRMRQCGEPLDRAMYKYWSRFMRLYLEELIDYCDDYYAFAKPTISTNNSSVFRGDKDYSDYATITENAKRWLRQRATAAYSQLTPYEMSDDEILGIPEDEDDPIDDTPYYTDEVTTPPQPTRFTVYDLRGIKLKSNAAYNTWRDGLSPGIYIVNGKKVYVQ